MALEQHIPESLVRRAQSGDAAAVSRVLEMVRPQVYRWALVQTSSPDDAEDIAQETLLRASRHLGDFAFGARFTTWLHTIMRRTTAEWRRTIARRAALLRERYERVGSEVQPDRQHALIDIVRANLQGLPARQREILDLVDLQEHTPAEVAARLGMNPATVRVHLLRARRTIRARVLASHGAIVEDAND